MRWIGISERALDLLCERALARETTPGEPHARKQIGREWIAEARAEIDAARLLVLRSAWRIDSEGAKATRADVSAIKYHVAGVMRRTIDRAIQVYGAAGLTDATPLGYWHRFERGANISDGADEVHKMAVARAELAKHRAVRSP
jgi:alkylation response protein AidB-like acyl-CoA dehydrogenase